MEKSAHYYIEFGPLRQFVSELSRMLAALLPVTRVGAYRLKKRLYAPLMVTVFVRHRSALPTEEALHELVEALRPSGFTVRFRISRYSGSHPLILGASYFEIYIYDQPIPAGVDLKRR
ncbi:hypothetical protein [Hymenobacter sp. UYCo722]|uniref:hypothetical protein n=1 Tax=Hymenobacter sp. UYCo722 TaxID=3156335 RepID=UPI003390C681